LRHIEAVRSPDDGSPDDGSPDNGSPDDGSHDTAVGGRRALGECDRRHARHPAARVPAPDPPIRDRAA
jgi:hypothetical protein